MSTHIQPNNSDAVRASEPDLSESGGPSYSRPQILAIMSGLMLGMLLAALDQTIVATALTRISHDLHRPDLYSWVVTSYLLTRAQPGSLPARWWRSLISWLSTRRVRTGPSTGWPMTCSASTS